MAKRLALRRTARRDIDEIIDYYLEADDGALASAFLDALYAVYERLLAHPRIGSPRYAAAAGVPALRAVALKRFPYLLFYVDESDRIDIRRVLHVRRDLAALLREVSAPDA